MTIRLASASAMGLALALAGCKDCCSEQREVYHLNGSLTAQPKCPSIILNVYEGSSTRCVGGCSMSGTNPGGLVLERTLPGPGAWSLDVAVSYVDESRPTTDVYAYCDTNRSGHADVGDACIGSASLAPGSHDRIPLEGACPGRD